MSPYGTFDGDERPDAHEQFRRLHHGERPLLLPNAWDHASAAALVRHGGFAAVGTTSLGVAAAAGLPDAAGATRAATVALARRLALLPVPVTVDVEGGFSGTPEGVAALAGELAAAGVAGINLEDGLPDGTLAGPALHAEKVRAVKEVAPRLFVNARTDTHWLDPAAPLAAALHRVRAYTEAGADGVFVPGLTAEDGIAALTGEAGVPVNVLFMPGMHTLDRLAALGVGRVSLGSFLFRAALGRAVEAAAAVASGEDWGNDGGGGRVPSYGEVQSLVREFG